jgi:DNA-binding transcriptional LysR family regulator
MDVAQLKTLIHVAELGSLSKASDRLHIAQPALSRQISLLEKELGTYLFERHGRGMKITDAGREVLAHATRIMEDMESIRRSVAGGVSSFRGCVAIGTPPTVGQVATVPLVRQIRQMHPELALRFSSAFSGYLLDWVQRGELDLAITYDSPPVPTLRIVPVMMESLLLVGPASAGLSMDMPVRFATLADQPLVLPSTRHGLRAILENCAREAGVGLASRLEADSFGALIDLVSHDFGLTVLPLASIHGQVEAGVLSAAPLIDPVPMRKLVQVLPADRRVSPAARFVGETFIAISHELIERKIWSGHMI